jgi:hypothetical protein
MGNTTALTQAARGGATSGRQDRWPGGGSIRSGTGCDTDPTLRLGRLRTVARSVAHRKGGRHEVLHV